MKMPLLLAAAVVLLPACKEKEPEPSKKAEARRGRPQQDAAAVAPATQATPDPMRRKTKEEIWQNIYVVPQGAHFSWERVKGLEVKELLEMVEKLPKEERKEAAKEMVMLFPAEEWRKMLEFVGGLPLGEDAGRAFSAASSKVAKLNPQVWMEHQAVLREHLPEYKYTAAAFEFGKSLAQRKDAVAGFDQAMAAPGMTPAARQMFVSGMFGEFQEEDAAVANAMLAKVTDAERADAVWSNPELFKDSILPGDATLAMVGKMAPEQQERMAEALGRMFSEGGPETARPEVDAIAVKLPPAQEMKLYLAYYKGLAAEDLNQTLERIPTIAKQEVRDQVIASMIPQIREYDKQTAVKWAESVSNPKERKRLLGGLK